MVRVWDLGSQKTIKELKGHTDIIYSLAWHHNSKLLASSGMDGTLKLWEVNPQHQHTELLQNGNYNSKALDWKASLSRKNMKSISHCFFEICRKNLCALKLRKITANCISSRRYLASLKLSSWINGSIENKRFKRQKSLCSGQNVRGGMSFLAIYVLVTRGPEMPHCTARMTNYTTN